MIYWQPALFSHLSMHWLPHSTAPALRLHRYYLIVLSLFGSLLVIGYWLYHGSEQANTTLPAAMTSHQQADYFMQQAAVKQYDGQGQLAYQLTSAQVAHYPNDGTAHLQAPHMTHYDQSGQVITADARHGQWLPDQHRLVLWDQVIMIQHDRSHSESATSDTVRLDTEWLTIAMQQAIAETDRPVLMTAGTSVVQATGMRACYQEGQVYLKAKVSGVYTPD